MPKPTKHTDIDLSSADVCGIIESCGKAGVRILKYGNLYLSLGPAPLKITHYPLSSDPRTPDHVRQNVETLQRDEEEVRAERLRMLMIEDPVEYERQLRDGELENEPGESDLAE